MTWIRGEPITHYDRGRIYVVGVLGHLGVRPVSMPCLS